MDKDARAHLKDPIGKPSGAELEKKRLDLRGQSVAEIVSILTSPPIGCEDGVDDAPPQASAIAPPSSAVPLEPSRFANAPPTMPRIADAPPMRPGIGDTNLDLQPLKSRPFEGEAAVGDLAHRLSHAPGLPEPPIQARQRPVVARFGRLPFVVMSTAIVAI